ncbi:MAG: hypothetical protein FJ126_08210 [Deltaproteobacteria bacterium]|nr:hypothetical protein [Deltaproteobacteria bacterium]
METMAGGAKLFLQGEAIFLKLIGVAQSNFPAGARRAVPKVQGHSTLCPYVKKQSEKTFGNRYK